MTQIVVFNKYIPPTTKQSVQKDEIRTFKKNAVISSNGIF